MLILSAVCIALAGVVATTAGAITLVALSVFFLYLTGTIYWAIINDVVGSHNVGYVGGFMHFLANIAGIIGPTVTGFIDKSRYLHRCIYSWRRACSNSLYCGCPFCVSNLKTGINYGPS